MDALLCFSDLCRDREVFSSSDVDSDGPSASAGGRVFHCEFSNCRRYDCLWTENRWEKGKENYEAAHVYGFNTLLVRKRVPLRHYYII